MPSGGKGPPLGKSLKLVNLTSSGAINSVVFACVQRCLIFLQVDQYKPLALRPSFWQCAACGRQTLRPFATTRSTSSLFQIPSEVPSDLATVWSQGDRVACHGGPPETFASLLRKQTKPHFSSRRWHVESKTCMILGGLKHGAAFPLPLHWPNHLGGLRKDAGSCLSLARCMLS
jgi:hypothetical protein